MEKDLNKVLLRKSLATRALVAFLCITNIWGIYSSNTKGGNPSEFYHLSQEVLSEDLTRNLVLEQTLFKRTWFNTKAVLPVTWEVIYRCDTITNTPILLDKKVVYNKSKLNGLFFEANTKVEKLNQNKSHIYFTAKLTKWTWSFWIGLFSFILIFISTFIGIPKNTRKELHRKSVIIICVVAGLTGAIGVTSALGKNKVIQVERKFQVTCLKRMNVIIPDFKIIESYVDDKENSPTYYYWAYLSK